MAQPVPVVDKRVAEKPYGREAAMEQILAAARTLFAERGFDAVGVRDVSALANVNHALLHRHFGTKENLLWQVMQMEARAFQNAAGNVQDPALALQRLFAANAEDLTFARILAFSLLSRNDTSNLLVPDGVLKRIVEEMTARLVGSGGSAQESERARHDAQETTAIVTALALGWLLFEPFLAAATGLDPESLPQARARVEELIADLV